MKRSIFKILTVVFTFLNLVGCEDEVTTEDCTSANYKVVAYEILVRAAAFEVPQYKDNVLIHTEDGESFKETLTVQLNVRYDGDRYGDNYTYTIEQGEASGKLLFTSENYDDNVRYKATITSENCPDPVEKTEEDIVEDSESFSCDENLVEIDELLCDEQYTFTWVAGEGADLTGVTLEAYGQSIDLSATNSASFAVSTLDFTKAAYISNNGTTCYISSNANECLSEGTTGTLSLTSPIAAGDDFIIELTDADLNISADNAETVEVALTTSKGESETVTLTETGNDTGIFSASLTTVLGADAGADNDGSITIELNTEITVVYVDALDAEGNESTEVSETVTVGGDAAPTCSDGIQNGDETGVDCGGSCVPCTVTGATGTLSLTSAIAGGDDFIIELTDTDLNISADNAETVEVALTTSKGESETVTLTETGNDTGIFSASLTTVLGADAGADNDGSITIELNTEITVVYVDALDAEGNESTEVSETVTVGGDAAPTCSDGIQNGDETGIDCGGSCVPCAAAENTVIFNGTTYSIDDGYYTEFEDDLNMDGVNDTYYLLLGLNELVDDGAGGEQYGFAISLQLYSDSPITSGTYEFEAEVTGLSNASEVSLNNGAVFHSLTGGTVILTIDGSDYTVEIDATTEGGDLNGTSTVPGF